MPSRLQIRTGDDWEQHRTRLREYRAGVLRLVPLPERVPLDVRMSEPLDHPWCTVRRVSYQLWPGVYRPVCCSCPSSSATAGAGDALCPHGHWEHGNANPAVQTRCLNFARLGYVTFSSTQNHYEDLYVGVSHQTLMVWNNIRALDLPRVAAGSRSTADRRGR